jgi:transporter family-2 protein
MKPLLAAMVAVTGMLLPLQAAMNANLRRTIGHPLWAGTINNVVGLLVLLAFALLAGARLNAPAKVVAETPWWSFLGGVCGATLVMSTMLAAQPLGAALLAACLISGQLLSSVVFDHMGWLGYTPRPIGLGRAAGVLLLAAGTFLIRRF